MKNLIIAITLLSLVSVIVFVIDQRNKSIDNQSNLTIIKVDANTFDQLTKQPDAIILDIRTDQEYHDGSLPGSKNIDFYQTELFKKELEKLDKSAKYLIFCRSGNRSAKAIELMKSLGFTNVAELDGGIISWQNAGLSLPKP